MSTVVCPTLSLTTTNQTAFGRCHQLATKQGVKILGQLGHLLMVYWTCLGKRHQLTLLWGCLPLNFWVLSCLLSDWEI